MLTNPLILSAIDRVPVKPETTKGEHYSEELKQRLNQFSAQSDSVVKKLLLKNEEKAKKTRFMIE